MSMKERSFQAESYRYGFNGKENDTDWEVQDYGFRIYKPELAKFLSVDPLTKSYPWYTPYQFAGNKPIWAVDLDGAEERYYTLTFDDHGKAHLKLTHEEEKWYLPDLHKVFVPDLNISYTFTPLPVNGNSYDSFEEFQKNPIEAINSGKFVTDQKILGDAVKNLVTDLLSKRISKVPSHNAGHSNFKKPNDRHIARKVDQSSVAKDKNSVVDNTVSLSADTKIINEGLAEKKGAQYILPNGRVYEQHDGTLYPVSGPGVYLLDRGEYKALGVLNQLGDTEKAFDILKNKIKMGEETIKNALEVYRKIKPN